MIVTKVTVLHIWAGNIPNLAADKQAASQPARQPFFLKELTAFLCSLQTGNPCQYNLSCCSFYGKSKVYSFVSGVDDCYGSNLPSQVLFNI